MQTVQSGTSGKITVEALNKENAFLNFLNIRGTVVGLDYEAMRRAPHADWPGTYSGRLRREGPGKLRRRPELPRAKGEQGVLLNGMAVNSSPELRDLRATRPRSATSPSARAAA